jgi:amino acid permease
MGPRIICVCFGLLLLYFAVSGAITGQAFGKFGKLDRISQPIGYWVVLISQVAAGVLLFFVATRL